MTGEHFVDELFHLFLDTNSLPHFPSIKDVDWRAICECASVRLVVCMQVIHELDAKKDDPRLGGRPARVSYRGKDRDLRARRTVSLPALPERMASWPGD